MLQKQKETILSLLKTAYETKNFFDVYLLPHKDFFDVTEAFTDFNCESLDDKQCYIDLIENLLDADKDAQVFAEPYGIEGDNENTYIYSNTLIIFSKLTLDEVKNIFNNAPDIFPDDIGNITDFNERPYYVVDENGNLCPAEKFINSINNGYSIYYCWWD